MRWETLLLDFADDPDVGSLSKIKTLIGRHLAYKSNPQLIGRLYLNQSQIYQKIRNYPLAYEALEKALEYFKEYNDVLNLAYTYYYQAVLLAEEKKIVQSQEQLNKGLLLLSNERDEELQLKCKIFHQIGINCVEKGLLDEAKKHFEEGIKIAQSNRFITEEIELLIALAGVYISLGINSEAKKIYYLVIPKIKNERELGRVLKNLGDLHFKLGNLKRAINAFTYSLKVQKKYKDENIPITLYQLAKIYLQIDLEKSKQFCQEGINFLLEGLNYRFSGLKEKQLAALFYIMGLYFFEKADRKNFAMFLRESLRIYKKYCMKEEWDEVYQVFQKHVSSDSKMLFDETTEIIKGLSRQGKLNLIKIVGETN